MKGSENPGSQTFLGIWPFMIICLNHIWSYVAISQRPNSLWYNLSRALSKFLIEIRIFIYQLFWYMASSKIKKIKSLWKRISSYLSRFSACQDVYVIFVNFGAPPPACKGGTKKCVKSWQNNQKWAKFSVFDAKKGTGLKKLHNHWSWRSWQLWAMPTCHVPALFHTHWHEWQTRLKLT